MNIRDIDLNLLVIFRSLMATLSVSQTAKQLHLSQPAVSHALSRLRHDLRDDLLVRSSRVMVATPFAKQIEGQINDVLAQLETVLARKAFDPSQAQGQIRIQTTEYFEQLVLPHLLLTLGKQAPGLQIVSTSTHGTLPKEDLAQGQCGIAIAGFFGELPEGFFQQEIFLDRMVCLRSKVKGGVNGQRIPLQDYLNLKHIYISPEGRPSGGIVDTLLAKQKKNRQVVASVSGFAAPAWICVNTDYSCTLPQRLASLYCEILSLNWFELPFETPKIRVVQVWHGRTQKDPLLRYIRQTIHDACKFGYSRGRTSKSST